MKPFKKLVFGKTVKTFSRGNKYAPGGQEARFRESERKEFRFSHYLFHRPVGSVIEMPYR
jgi:hypothetical protein